MPSIRHKADVSFEDGRIVVRLGGGVLFSFPIAGNRRLEGATPEQLANVEVDERGMHWPDIDEDLSLAGLLRGDWGQHVHNRGGEAMAVCEGEGTGYKAVEADGTRKPVVYLETSFVSYLTARDSNDPENAAKQEATRRWWKEEGAKWQPVVSEAVRDEAEDGDADAVAKRLEFIEDFESVSTTKEAEELADLLMSATKLDAKHRTDAVHMALTAIRKADLLLSWNCKHIANSVTIPKVMATLTLAGYACPSIATPRQRLEERDNA